MPKEILRVENLTFRYESYNAKTGCAQPGDRESLSRVSFSVEEGSFVLITGDTGSGKSTLLQLIKKEVAPAGQREGRIEPVGLAPKDIALLKQNPIAQCVTDKVWHEMAFGLENEGLSQEEMEQRISETACFFDLERLLLKDTAQLSGGELQLVNLAALMVMRPKLLLLDEPTAQLDPAAEQRFLQTLRRIHEELGITILMAEHNLSESLSLSTHFMALEEGRLLLYGRTQEALKEAFAEKKIKSRLNIATEACYVWRQSSLLPDRDGREVPLTVCEGRKLLAENTELIRRLGAKDCGENVNLRENADLGPDRERKKNGTAPAITGKDLWFRYHRDLADVLRGMNFQFCRGSIYAILGGNGAGKSTLLRLLAGLEKADEGRLKLCGRPVLLPQNPESLFLADFLRGEAASMGKSFSDLPDRLKKYGEDANPYDLSGGEKELLALWKVLASDADIFLLDEPQKGLDLSFRRELTRMLRSLKDSERTVLFVTHDTDFAAETADYACMLSSGRISSPLAVRDFFSANEYYTTPTVRMTRGLLPDCVTREDILC